jgi:hypothetical protein
MINDSHVHIYGRARLSHHAPLRELELKESLQLYKKTRLYQKLSPVDICGAGIDGTVGSRLIFINHE